MSLATAAVCFIACHGGPADHFATFVEALSKEEKTSEVFASGPAWEKFQARGIEVKYPFSVEKISPEEEDLLAEEIAKTCSASVVITDVGHAFDIKIQEALARKKEISRFAYYDNPEAFVPGGYSDVAAKVMSAASGVLFANSNLATAFNADLGSRKMIGIGYYPAQQAEKIAQRREVEKGFLRNALFSKNNLTDSGQKVFVYFGGNNTEYFEHALPAFLSLLERGMEQIDLNQLVIVIQQHPGAKRDNIDTEIISKRMGAHPGLTIIFSDFSSEDAQVIADAALYYQTSMGPQFVLAGIPTTQIGHNTFEDILIKNKLITSITKVDELISMINNVNNQKAEIQEEVIFNGLGMKKNWFQNLNSIFSN